MRAWGCYFSLLFFYKALILFEYGLQLIAPCAGIDSHHSAQHYGDNHSAYANTAEGMDEDKAAAGADDNAYYIVVDFNDMEGLIKLFRYDGNYAFGGHIENLRAGIKPNAEAAHNKAYAGEHAAHNYALRCGEKAEYPAGEGVAVAEEEARYKLEQNPRLKILSEDNKLQKHQKTLPYNCSQTHFKAGYKVEQKDETYSVVVREGLAERLEAESKKANWFEFNTTGDTQGWSVNNGQGSVLNGIFAFTASPVASAASGFDPSISNKGLNVPTAYYKTMEIRMKVTLDDAEDFGMSKIYFATTTQGSLSESKTLRFKLSDYEPDAQGFYTVTLDAAKNEYWKEAINQIRFDPTDFGGYYEIDYIRFIADASYEAELEAVAKAEREANKNLYAVDDGAPFFIQNADAELTTSNANLRKNTSIKEDDLIEGNHAYYVVPENNNAKSWVYFIAPTRFLPGATYKVSFDARVVADQFGNPATGALLSWNMRYSENVDGQFQQTVNHYSSFRDQRLSTADGWQHFEFEVTIKENIPDTRQYDYFCFFMDPNDSSDGGFLNYSYMIDNIKVEVVE